MHVIHPRNAMNGNHGLAGVGLVLAIGLAACGGSEAAGTNSTATDTAGAVTSSSTTTTSTSDASGSDPVGASTNVNANSATVEELEAAFATAGIPNADRWAREVAEYRPYAADPTWAQLRHELGKYNIDPAVLEQIISLLEV